MFRDVFARVTVPIIFGRVGIKPHEMTDLSDMQVRWLYSIEHDRRMFLDQFSDIFDFAGGTSNLGKYKAPPKDSAGIFGLAAFQLQAAAAALSAAFDFRGAVQSALVGTELALKAGLAAAGVGERTRKRYRHNLPSMTQALQAAKPALDAARGEVIRQVTGHSIRPQFDSEGTRV